MDASGGVEAGLETAVALGRSTGPRRPASSSTSATARTPTRRAALDALRAAFGNKIAPLHLAIGEPPRRSAATSTSSIARRTRSRTASGGRDPDPGRARGRGRHAPRPAARGGRRGRRRRPDQVPRGRGDQRRGARGVPPQGRRESILAPVLVGSATKGIGLRGLLDAIVRYLPSPAEEPPVDARDAKPARRSRSRRTRPGRCSSGCSRPPPIRSSAG